MPITQTLDFDLELDRKIYGLLRLSKLRLTSAHQRSARLWVKEQRRLGHPTIVGHSLPRMLEINRSSLTGKLIKRVT